MNTLQGEIVAKVGCVEYYFNASYKLHNPAKHQVWQLATLDLNLKKPSSPVSINTRALCLGFIIPCAVGKIARADIVSLRLVDLPGIKSVSTFADPGQSFDFESIKRTAGSDEFQFFPEILKVAAAGFTINPDVDIATLTSELVQRLSMAWILPSSHPDRRRTLALVDGRYDPHVGEPLYSAAKSLAIDLVVVERPGHWIGQAQYRSWYKDLLIIDMMVDEGLSDRIVEAIQVSGHKIDGIITRFDPRAAATAKAAERLGIALAPAEAFEVATDKFRTSLLDGHSAYRVSSLYAAKSIIDEGKAFFPLILKPVAGFLSEGVFLVQNLYDLENAIHAIITVRGNDALMEPYCDGLEVDANFVLADGEVLFFEASDDFPTSAEEGPNGTFLEQANVLPSSLPQQELQIIEKSLHQRLLQLGFRDRIFHLEARMQHSTMEYVKVNGTLDLEYRPIQSLASNGAPQPSAWLIEINPRPPGIQSFQATALTYGVDYIGLSLLLAVGDRERARILAQPFLQRHQYWSQILFIPTPKGGIFNSDDVCAELKRRCPNLASHISISFYHWNRGDVVPDPLKSGKLTWIAYYLMNSRVSRRHLWKSAKG
ncbi:hypothetical protein MGYG_03467 [Nannizzia gypsea CBS 118893]|uniref:ATP-grasp domain-containing protein n=1 Tax=Arthroderma gypseum (strain ATCC MYA-4604 / CBS 118893) TaxID=535722 RepID=E4US47_ARTGP|nr:hypothetical protein MGYG_03467 [Nannizzia gypsea CBS 118893]EFR00465.1 hypothetical protein MGYG_03467 [Nannizzia gypsea CBS 118893]